MKRLGKFICLLFMLFSSFSFSLKNSQSSKAYMVLPDSDLGGGGSCGSSTYLEASFTDPREPDGSLIKHSNFYIIPEDFETAYRKDFNLENLIWMLESDFYFYEASVDTCAGTSEYEMLWMYDDYQESDLTFSNDDNWVLGQYGVYKFTATLNYDGKNYSAVATVCIFEDPSDYLYIDGQTKYETTATNKIDVEEILANVEVKSLVPDYTATYTYEDEYSSHYSEVGFHKVIVTAQMIVDGTTYTQVLEILITVTDNIAPTFDSNFEEILVSNTVILSPEVLYSFLGIKDNVDSYENIDVQVINNTYQQKQLIVGEYEFSYKATDKSGNVSEEKVIKVIVTDDLILPIAITNTNLVLSNSYLEPDSLAYVVAYINGFSSKEYIYSLDNDDYVSTQYKAGLVERGAQVDVEFTFNDDRTKECSAVFKTVDSKYLSDNDRANEYNSDKNKLLRFLEMLWQMLLAFLEKILGGLI
ncbi:MAG: hypothetical protein E7184_00180 [Erysipelotrichaceae bacterium]|nr:hypothetical protein [Erysipelotrichaceae bacterium]